jgi:O-antigen/teichoic acid export membrane protein
LRPAIRNVGYNLAGQILPMAVAVVSLPILAHRMGTERLGFLALAWSLIGYFALLDLGLSRIVTRRIALAEKHHRMREEAHLVRLLCVRMFLGVAAVSIVLAWLLPARWVIGSHASETVAAEAAVALPVLLLTIPVTVATGLLRGALEGMQRFAKVNVLRTVFGAAIFVAPLAMLPFRTDLFGLTLSLTIVRVLSLAAHAWWALRSLDADARASPTPPAGAATLPSFGAMMRESGWMTVSNVVGPLMTTFDRFVLAAMVSLSATSYYFVPQEIALRLLVIPGAVATTIFPMLARLGAGAGAADRQVISRTALGAIAAVSLFTCGILAGLAGPLLSVWMGGEFARSAAPVAAIIAIGLFANCCSQAPFAWIQAAGRADVTGKLHLLQLIPYIVVLVALTWQFGIVGTAVAWSLRALIDCGLLFIASGRLFPAIALRTELRAIVVGVGLLTVLALHPALPDGLVRTTIAALAGCATLALSVMLARQLRPAAAS